MIRPSTCLADADLLRIAAGDGPGDAATALHLAECPACRSALGWVRTDVEALRAVASAAGELTADCLDESALAGFVDGHVSGPARDRCVRHLAGCGRCRRAAAGLSQLCGTPEVRGALHAGAAGRPFRWRRAALALGGVAAAAAFLLVTAAPDEPSPDSGHRGTILTAADAPIPIAPAGSVPAAPALHWTSVTGADRYRVVLFDPEGTALLDAEVSDTVLAIPDSLVLRAGTGYRWQVEARHGPGRWVASELIEFFLQVPAEGGAALPRRDSLHLIASGLPETELATAVRTRSSEVRDAIALLLAAADGHGASRGDPVATAVRLARAHAAAWGDAFLLRDLERVRGWPVERRVQRWRADSLRRVGASRFAREGADAALASWHLALRHAGPAGDSVTLAALLGNIGAAHAWAHRPDSAIPALQQAQALAVALGDLRVEANALGELAGIRDQEGDAAGATALYTRAASLRERIGDSRGLAADLNNLAGLARTQGDLAGATRHLEGALAINRRDDRAEAAATNLVNLAALAALDGEFERAEGMYVEAATTWRREGRWADLAEAERGLGELALRRGDYPVARGRFRAALALYNRTGPPAETVAMQEAIARVHAAEGDLQGALDALAAIEEREALPAELAARVAQARGELAAGLNQQDEAAAQFERAVRLYRAGRDSEGEGTALLSAGGALVARGDVAGGMMRFEHAVASLEAGPDRRNAGLARVWLADARLRSGDTAASRVELVRAAGDLARAGDPVAEASALVEWGALEYAAGRPRLADSLFRTAAARLGERAAPAVRWRIHDGLAQLRAREGRHDAAADELRAAIAAIEHSAHSLALPERRSAYLEDKWDTYARLADLERTLGRPAAAFEVSERMRAGTLHALIARGRVAAPTGSAGLLVARTQDLERRIAELGRDLELVPRGTATVRGLERGRSHPAAREALLRAQAEHADLQLRLREQAPRAAAVLAPTIPSWRDVGQRLAPGEVFIEYLLGETGSLAYVIGRDTLTIVPLGASRRQLARTIGLARSTLQAGGQPAAEPWRVPLRRLHRDLIDPLERAGLLSGAHRLVIAPHGDLHYLPFAALLDESRQDGFLVARYELAMTPSAAVWLALASRQGRPAGDGVLAVAPFPDRLPGTTAEVEAIRRRFGRGARVLRGAAASETALRREAGRYAVVHLASFGVLNKQNPLFSFVQLAPGGGEDGQLGAYEATGIPLAAELVVLSACQTGLGSGALADVPAGDDWVGLTQSFLVAGADRVVASLWAVEDAATARLMREFYARYRPGGDPVRALAEAQRALLRDPEAAEPYRWAGFVASGGA